MFGNYTIALRTISHADQKAGWFHINGSHCSYKDNRYSRQCPCAALKEIDEARITRAYADARSISNAVIVLKKDTGKWPNMDGSCTTGVRLLVGEGTVPSNALTVGFDGASQMNFSGCFTGDDTGCYGSRWKGPYMSYVSSDPWGNSYLVNTKNFAGTDPVWILSAGPNGTFETGTVNPAVIGDDAGIRIK